MNLQKACLLVSAFRPSSLTVASDLSMTGFTTPSLGTSLGASLLGNFVGFM